MTAEQMDIFFWIYTAAILVLICLSALFSGSETALTSASRGKLKSMAEKGNTQANRALAITEDRDRLISAVLLGNNFVNILATALATSMFSRLLGDSGIAVATIVMTILLLIFAELLPKSFALSQPEVTASKASAPIRLFINLLFPIVVIAQTIVNGILHLFGMSNMHKESSKDVQDEIIGRIGLGIPKGMFDKDDQQRVFGVLDIRNRTVENVMRHRSEIEVLDARKPIESIINQCMQTPHSRLPVFQDEHENITKVAHVRDIYKFYFENFSKTGNGGNWTDILMEPYFVPETTPLDVQMQEFLSKQTHFALVVDEYGALQGLVTLEDILEEIVGEIKDEHDIEPAFIAKRNKQGNLEVDGVMPVHELNKNMGWELPETHANTIAGLIIHEIQYIPSIGEQFEFKGHTFEVTARERNRITRLVISDKDKRV